jgi:hypothetical protein
VLGKSQEDVRQALEAIRQALPFSLRGIDSDNGSEFINGHLYRYCQADGIQFTRGRPYKKDDNAHIEQKNWTHVRRLLGYARYDSAAAREAINDLSRNELRLFQNLFLPSVKLEKKEGIGSRLRRHYQAPQTPFQRVAASPLADPVRVAELRGQHQRLDPFQLSARVQAKREGIFRLSAEAPASALPRPDSPPAVVRAPDRAKLVAAKTLPRPSDHRPRMRKQAGRRPPVGGGFAVEKQPPGYSRWK